MTMLRGLIAVSALAVAFLLLGCEHVPTAETTGDAGDPIWLAKGKGGGKPGGTPASPEISFASGGPDHRNLQVMDADGGNVTEIYSGAYLMHSSWSDQGDGTSDNPYVILVSMSGSAPQLLEKLSVVVEGGVPVVQDIQRLSSETRYHDASVRPGGSCFVAVDIENVGPNTWQSSLVLGDMATSALELLYQADVDVVVEHPDWNADGSRVAFIEWGPYPNKNGEVRVIDIGSIDIETCQATTPSATTAFPFSWVDNPPSNLSWARTSNELLLDVDHQLYRVDLDAPEPALGIPFEAGYTAVWSPDDTQMAYRRDGKFYIKTFEQNRDEVMRHADSVPDWRR